MMLLSHRSLLGIAAVVDIAAHCRIAPVAAKALAARHNLPPRHLESLLQALVREGILKGIRGPRGGYELARERRRISAGEIVRAAMAAASDETAPPQPESQLVEKIVAPLVGEAGEAFLRALDGVTIDDLCQRADKEQVFADSLKALTDFTI